MLIKHSLAFLIGILLVLAGDCTLLRPPTAQNPLSTVPQLPSLLATPLPSPTATGLPSPSPTPSPLPTATMRPTPSPTVTTIPSPSATPTPLAGLDEIALPVGFLPSGITIGNGSEFFVGSRGSSSGGGQIYRGDLLTGAVELFIELATDEMAAGLQFDPRTNYLFVSGANDVQVYDATSGALLQRYVVSQEQGLVSDLVVTAAGVYAAELFHPVFYHIPLAPNGTLLAGAVGETIALSDDYDIGIGYQPFQTTGIAATSDGKWLIIANSNTGTLYRVVPSTGAVWEIGCIRVPFIDGLVLDGETLYVTINADMLVTVQLDRNLVSCDLIVGLSTSDYAFNMPTAAALFGDALYVVNGMPGRSRTPAAGTSDQEYAVILRVPRR